MVKSQDIVTVIYDGDCPVCGNISLKRNLKDSLKNLILIDARSLNSELLLKYKNRGFNLNDGMLVIINQTEYYGHEGLIKLFEISQHKTKLIKSAEKLYAMFNSKLLYFILVKLRLVLLKALSKNHIESMGSE